MSEIIFEIKCTGKKRDVKKIKETIVDYLVVEITGDLGVERKAINSSDPNYLFVFERIDDNGYIRDYKVENFNTIINTKDKDNTILNISFKTYSFGFEIFKVFFEYLASNNPSVQINGFLKSKENEFFHIQAETKDSFLIIIGPELDIETGEYKIVEVQFDPSQNKYISMREIEKA